MFGPCRKRQTRNDHCDLALVQSLGPHLKHAAFPTVGMPPCDSPSNPIDFHNDNCLPSPLEAAEVSKTMAQHCDG